MNVPIFDFQTIVCFMFFLASNTRGFALAHKKRYLNSKHIVNGGRKY